jgi:hypothetical protein
LYAHESIYNLSNGWTEAIKHCEAIQDGNSLHRQTQHYNETTSVLELDVPQLTSQASQYAISSLPNSTNSTNYFHQQNFGSVNKDASLPLTLPLVAHVQEFCEPSSMVKSEELPRICKCSSASKAEQMISDVEKLYEFGVDLAIIPKDPSLVRSLRKMKERFGSMAIKDMAFQGDNIL